MTDTSKTRSQLLSSTSFKELPDYLRHASIDVHIGSSGQESATPDRTLVQACEEKVYSLISRNNGKLIFSDLLSILGGPENRKLLYNVLSKLSRQGKVTRIRGIGRLRIEFYYYDTRKMKKFPKSAAEEYISRLA